jgi:hypothetical protein
VEIEDDLDVASRREYFSVSFYRPEKTRACALLA